MIKTVSLETAKLLMDAGFPQNTCQMRNMLLLQSDIQYYQCALPTTDELLEELPYRIVGEHYILELVIFKNSGDYTIGYKGKPDTSNAWVENESLPEALANMWLRLKKEGLL